MVADALLPFATLVFGVHSMQNANDDPIATTTILAVAAPDNTDPPLCGVLGRKLAVLIAQNPCPNRGHKHPWNMYGCSVGVSCVLLPALSLTGLAVSQFSSS